MHEQHLSTCLCICVCTHGMKKYSMCTKGIIKQAHSLSCHPARMLLLVCVCECVHSKMRRIAIPLLGEELLLFSPTGEKKVLLLVAFMQIGIQ